MQNRNHRPGRIFVFALGLSLCTLAAVDLSHAQSAPKPPPPKTAAQEFKNIKVLKNLPANQLIPTMRLYADSLGVRCTFCHVENDFSSDQKKHKQIARQMIVMMNDINKRHKVVMNQVTCYTCHRGSEEPTSTPPKPGGAPPSGHAQTEGPHTHSAPEPHPN